MPALGSNQHQLVAGSPATANRYPQRSGQLAPGQVALARRLPSLISGRAEGAADLLLQECLARLISVATP